MLNVKWKVVDPCRGDTCIQVVEDVYDGELICTLECVGSWQQEPSPLQVKILKDAYKIAATNDLLEACTMMLEMMEAENLDESHDAEAEVLRDAISRATKIDSTLIF